MDKVVDRYKGISPGAVLERELKKKNIRQSAFAGSLNVVPQALNAIIKGRRRLTAELALKIDYALGLEEGTMGVLQALHETKQIKQAKKLGPRPDVSKLRRILFWDTDFDKLDWQNHHLAIISRIMERGNQEEQEEIIRFYGQSKIAAAIAKTKR